MEAERVAEQTALQGGDGVGTLKVVSSLGWGVRVGEASHPGPLRRRRRRVASTMSSGSQVEATLLDDLERDLMDMTMADSDVEDRGAATQWDSGADFSHGSWEQSGFSE